MRVPSVVAGERAWLGLALAWIVCGGALFGWLARADILGLREALKSVQFWSLQLGTVAFAIATAAALPILARLARRHAIPGRWIAVAALLALVLTTMVAPRTNRIYFDEHIYQHIGQNLADLRLAQMCNDGLIRQGTLVCAEGEYNKQPSGYPQLLSVLYRLGGVRESWAFWFNGLCVALIVLVAGLAAALLFEDGRAGGFAALVMALIPEQLRWSSTAAVEPSAALVCLVAVLAAIVFVRDRSTTSLVWLVAASSLAVQFRAESLLCLPLIGLIVWRLAPDEMLRPRLWAAMLAGLLLSAALIAHLVAVRSEPWGASGPRFSWQYLQANFAVNAPFYVADQRFPALYTVAAVCGLLLAGGRGSRMIASVYFLMFWGVFLVFYAGSYNYGADVRYSLMSYPPLAMLAGAGLSGLAALLARRSLQSSVASAALASVVLLQFVPYVPYVRSIGEEASAARADVEIARAFRDTIPDDAVVLTHTPSMFLLWGTSALQTSIATTAPERIEYLKSQTSAVFLHWGFWCNVDDAVQRSFCTNALERFPGELVTEHEHHAYRFRLYRLF